MLLSEKAAFCDVGAGCELCSGRVAALEENSSSSSSSSSNMPSRFDLALASGIDESTMGCELLSSAFNDCAGASETTLCSVSIISGGDEVA